MAVTINQWKNVCRLCFEEKKEMLSIFGSEGLQRKVAQKLRACLPVLVYKTDPLPKRICQFCAARLDDAYEFREYCLSVYKSMHIELLSYKNLESVQIFFDAMNNSPDPCQAQLCKDKARALPPLVPLPASLPIEKTSTRSIIDNVKKSKRSSSMETLTELPCEVEIKEINAIPILGLGQSNEQTHENNNQYYSDKEEKRTSILEQVLTGNLTINDCKELPSKTKLSSQWWCAPCNNYFKSREALIKHLQLYCPRIYTCRECSISFESVEELAKHEGTDHLKINLDPDETIKECYQCDRVFVSWEMLRQHRLRDHIAESVEVGTDTWCPLCNRFFPSIELYNNHMQLHDPTESVVSSPSKIEETSKEIRKDNFGENVKSLMCPTCGKVCTQQSALSNHMRTHEPKRHKCDICGRSFGLFIRLAAHRLSEHNLQPSMTCIEQEEALNAEREAREAREAKTRGKRNRSYAEIIEKEDIPVDCEPPTKRNSSMKNVARCGICLEWFNDHTTMLTHLKTHSDNQTYKSFNCQLCKKSFKEKWQLFRHEMSHKRKSNIGIAAFTCNVCKETFTEKSAYKNHQKIHVVDRTYHCSKCNKLFFKEISLLTHQCSGEPLSVKKKKTTKTATPSSNGNKLYKCSKCSATFGSSQSRNSHMRVHSENHIAARKNDVKNSPGDHKMPKLSPETSTVEPNVQSNEEEILPTPVKRTLVRTAGGYRCGICQSPFVLRELAVAHLRSAHPVMPYQCPYCKKRFTTQYTFTHHIKTEHPNKPEM